MKLYYWNSHPNFGDELNRYVWEEILPQSFFDQNEPTFLGIGTLLSDRLPDKEYWILGAGAGYGDRPGPRKMLRVFAVRGPLTARALGVHESLAITDPAILLRRIWPEYALEVKKSFRFGFVPHWQEHVLNKRALQWCCKMAGIEYINPCAPSREVVDKISQSEVIVAEAMHGAIVADTIGVRWIPVITSRNINEFKWKDWCGSIEMDYRPVRIFRIGSALKFTNPLRGLIVFGVFLQLLAVRFFARPRLSSRAKLRENEMRLMKAVDELVSEWKVRSGRAF